MYEAWIVAGLAVACMAEAAWALVRAARLPRVAEAWLRER